MSLLVLGLLRCQPCSWPVAWSHGVTPAAGGGTGNIRTWTMLVWMPVAAAGEELRLLGFWLEFSLTSFDYRVLCAQW